MFATNCGDADIQAHSAKADQNPYVLRTPGILENVPECCAKPNCFCNFMKTSALSGLRAKTSQNIVAKRNLVPPLRALQSDRASSAAFALSAELRLAQHYMKCSAQELCKYMRHPWRNVFGGQNVYKPSKYYFRSG